jgi:hypothetical protein
VQLEPKLNFKFFNTTKTSRPWHIVEGDDGGLEDTMDQRIDPDDLILLEHTSGCISTHQGEHAMPFCDAQSVGDSDLRLLIHGGLPAHFSSLTMDVDTGSREFTCSFEAVYPSPKPVLNWRITKKSIRAKSLTVQPGRRCYAWISVEFDEVWMENGAEQKRSYKIEGPVKPVIESPVK